MPLFNRPLLVVSIGCMNILSYTVVCVVILINLKYDQYSEYDYNDYNDVVGSYQQRREIQAQREIYGSIYAATCIVMDVVTGFLIWGVVEKHPRYMAPWILGTLVVLIYSAIVVMEDIFVKTSFQGVSKSTGFFAILIVGFGIQLLCLALVYSLYKDIELEVLIKHLQTQTNVKDREVKVDEKPQAEVNQGNIENVKTKVTSKSNKQNSKKSK